MTLVFCLSSLFIPHTLTLIQGSKNKVVVYSHEEGVCMFFNALNLDNVEVFYRADLKIRQDIYSLKRIREQREEFLSRLIRFNIAEIYFFHSTFGSIENWLIKNFRKRAQLNHIAVFNDLPFRRRYNLSSIIGVLKGFLIHGILTEPLWNGDEYIYKLPDSFFVKNKVKKLQLTLSDDFIQNVVLKNFYFGKRKILFLTGSVVENRQVEESEYIEKVDALIDLIGKENIIAKPHPRYRSQYGREKELDVIPHYVPANVLFYFFDFIVGYSSASLSEGCSFGKKVISTLEFMKPISKEGAFFIREYMVKNSKHDCICFPHSIQEFKSILSI